MGRFFEELKRRNVFRVAIAYVVVAWLILQVGDALAPALLLPDWVNTLLAFFLILGLPIALFFAWAYELTPEGVKPQKDVDHSESVAQGTGRKLDFLIIAVLAVAVIVFAIDRFLLVSDTASGGGAPEVQASIAVLPFVDMSPNKDQEYFSDGIAEELLNQLTRLHGLHVAGRTSSFAFKNKNEDLRAIGEKLNVANILEGSVRKAGEQVRITVQLIKASDGYHLWSQTYDRDLNDIFAIQEETAKAVADALSVTLGVGDIDFGAGGTRNFEAYDARLEAQSLLLRQGTENVAHAIRLLEKAVSLDPAYADAWSLLSTAYGIAAALWISERAEEYLEKSVQAANRAREIAPEAVQSLRVSAGLYTRDRNWVDAERSLKKVLELAPADLINVLSYGSLLLALGRPEEAIQYARQAVKTDPLSLGPSSQLALAHEINGDIDTTLRELEHAKGLIGNHVLLNGTILVFAMEVGDRVLIDKYHDIIQHDPATPPMGRSFSRTIHELLDSPEAARTALHRAYEDPDFSNPLSHSVIATYAAYFRDDKLALKILNELDEAGVLSGDTVWRPVYKGVRRLPGFKELVKKRGLVDYWRSTGNWGKFCHPVGHADFECE